jgi:hypothetical protein
MTDRSETVVTEERVRAHQLGQGGFRLILPDDIAICGVPTLGPAGSHCRSPSQNAP